MKEWKLQNIKVKVYTCILCYVLLREVRLKNVSFRGYVLHVMHAFTYCGGCIHSWGCHKIPGFGNFLFRSSYNKRIHNVHPCGPAAITWKLYLLLVYTSISDSMFGNVSKTWLHFFRRKKVTFLYICFVLYLMFFFTFLFQMYTYNIITLYTHFSYFFAFSYVYHITWKRKYGKKKSEKNSANWSNWISIKN